MILEVKDGKKIPSFFPFFYLQIYLKIFFISNEKSRNPELIFPEEMEPFIFNTR